jgi:Zn-finger nucleic acid-binding protein
VQRPRLAICRTLPCVPAIGTAFHLERCPSCHGVWFDDGEWSALATAHLDERLDEFWTAEWRTRQRREHDRHEYETRVKEAFGPPGVSA